MGQRAQRTSGLTHFKPDLEWIRVRRELLKQVKGEVLDRLGGSEPDDVKVYGARLEDEIKKSQSKLKISDKAALLREIEKADIVYGGDFHALGQAQRTHLKILRSLTPSDRPVFIGLECFSQNAQRWLNAYLKNEIDLPELRERARWQKTWGFPWENYKPLLELAKKRGFHLIALNETKNSKRNGLRDREMKAAARIQKVLEKNPGALIYVIFGDLHLASMHLPHGVRSLMAGKARLREVIVHLNSERIYFQLARRGLELSTDVVSLSQRRDSSTFCVLTSPPWVQWQSYLLYLERTEGADPDLDHSDNSNDNEEFDPTDQVAGMIRMIAGELGLDPKFGSTKNLSDLNVFSPDDRKVWSALGKRLNARDRLVARSLIATGRSFLLPQTGTGYLGQATVNHAAALAGQYIHARLSKRHSTKWQPPGDFQSLIWIEAVAYFASKLINHKRQAETVSDLRAQLTVANSIDQGREAMKLALDQLMSEIVYLREKRRRRRRFQPRQKSSYFEAGRILGGMLGERLYLGYRSRKLSQGQVVRMLKFDMSDAKKFAVIYEGIIDLISESQPNRNLNSTLSKTKRERL